MYLDYWMIALLLIAIIGGVWQLQKRAFRTGISIGAMAILRGALADQLIGYNGSHFVPYRQEDAHTYIKFSGIPGLKGASNV